MANDYEYELLKKAQEHLVLARKIENKDCDIFDHPQFNVIEELAEEMSNGINVQVRDLVKAIIDSEPCLFNNSSDNLIPINQKGEKAMPADLIYNEEENVWVYTGKVFTLAEQITQFKETYADYANKNQWRELLAVFMFYKQHGWADLIAENEQFADVVEKLHMNILYGKKLRIEDYLNQLVVIAGLLNKTKENK